MRFVVLVTALAMPAVSYLSQTGMLGPDNGEISNRYPTLLVAAGYAFAIWGLIFLLDIAVGAIFASKRGDDPTLRRVAPAIAAGFALTGAWSPVFTLQLFWVALAIIWVAFGTLAWAAVQLSRAPGEPSRSRTIVRVAISLHAGWLSLAAFLNIAQVLTWQQIPEALTWSLVLYAAAAAVLLGLNQRMRGNLAYAAAALWGLAAVYVKQSGHDLPGSDTAAWVAVGIAVLLAAQTITLRVRAGGATAGPA